MPSDPTLWYKDAVFYELHVKAFQDGSGDGVGDFKGLIGRLDYLQELGVDCIWLLPFYPSPLRDDGYYIADYYGIHPGYGNIEDLQTFLDEAHGRGMRVIADLVLNHTSDQHTWFQRARRAPRGSPERDWYVWSDTNDRYPDARIIFTDTEPSNWSWDPVAGQYYWHRFFAHQPDLNWDNPRVKEEMFAVMEYWLDRGIDGFRADAVPYLIERDGTICENLPETHAILKEFRKRLDGNYPDRILLAQANQWPEDVCEYFGDSDEFHMAFHFQLMPRIFMAVRQGIRRPIVEIIERTPAIPDDCQWCMFLRNHDELTLEMVTDEERDYMYQEYAADPRMRLNLGIRRRLSPLMDNDRRKIELLNSILFTMPGTPVVYYGDEIGMGDNIYLGDRDGVRTPMQWSPDRNAGFSRAEPERLFLPVISDSVYGYQSVNVEAQGRSQFSLLNWMRRLIQVRRGHPALSRGTIVFLEPENEHVLVYVREHEGDMVLVVGNLSSSAQPVLLDLSAYAGRVPVELLGGVEFMSIDAAPFPLTLAPYGFFWFALRPPALSRDELSEARNAGLSREWAAEDALALADPRTVSRLIGSISVDWFRAQRWSGGKTHEVVAIDNYAFAALQPDGGSPLVLAIVRLRSRGGGEDHYLLPLTFRPPPGGRDAAVPLTDVLTTARVRALYEALHDPSAALAFVRLIEEERVVAATIGTFTGRWYGAERESVGHELTQIQPFAGEQSNTSIRFGRTAMLKLFRRLESGPNPDVELSHALAGTSFKAFPELLGSLDFQTDDLPATTVAALYRFVQNRGDAWTLTLKMLDRFLGAASRSAADPESAAGRAALTRMGGGYLPIAQALGTLTAEMHLALASTSDPAFAAERIDASDVRRWTSLARDELSAVIGDLSRLLEAAPGAVSNEARGQLGEFLRDTSRTGPDLGFLERLEGAAKIRIHGDYHLGQVLQAEDPTAAGGEWIVFDFEGEPARSLDERRGKYSPLKDVAGMLRSFDYALRVAMRLHGSDGLVAQNSLRSWGGAWLDIVREYFLESYTRATDGASFVPADVESLRRVVAGFELEKAIYELKYEMNNRPDWISIPLQGIFAIRDRTG